ncbi:MAG: PaaI family thioesterase [Kiloniellaceae bacterium]
MARISLDEINEICEAELPWVRMLGFVVEEIGQGACRVRLPQKDEFLRPGGTVSGPALMSLADYAMYVAVLSAVGRVELAVTTNLTCNFLRRPKPGDVIAECRLLKLGKRLAYGEASIYAAGDEDAGPVAHVTATYSIPPERPAD